jgi:hypothetical protein
MDEDGNGPGRSLPLAGVISVWTITRLGLLALAALPGENSALRDVSVYHRLALDVWCHGRVPGRDFPWEYPPGALPFAAPPTGCASIVTFTAVFLLLAFALDLATLFLLRTLPYGDRAACLWLVLIPLLGPIAITRFDLAECALVVAAYAALHRRPALAGALLTAAAAVKLWPIVLVAAVLNRRTLQRRFASGGLTACLALGSLFAVTGTLGAFASAATYQGRRGLQVESVLATPFAWLRVVDIGHVSFSYGSWQVDGTVADVLAASSPYLTVVAVGGLLLVTHRNRERGLPLLGAALVSLLLVTDKVLSTQYVLWIITMMAVLAGLDGRLVRWWPWALGLTVALTHLVYPPLYGNLLHGGWLGTGVLTIRNALLLALTASLTSHAWRGGPSGPATDPQTRATRLPQPIPSEVNR